LLPKAFPMLTELQHQVRFKLRLGRLTHDHDAVIAWEKDGTADILLSVSGHALAILELKREDHVLTSADRDQALSYARQLTPQPPLVITSNGNDIAFFDSATGEPWTEGDVDAVTVRRLFENASTLAAANSRWAVETLLGPSAGVWVDAVRKESQAAIDQLTDEIGESGRPFVKGFSFPRKATAELFVRLSQGAPMAHLTGAPLSGKSNVLKQLCRRTLESSEFACLYIPSGSNGPGLFQRLANMLSATLEWPVSTDDVRQWLRRMAKSDKGTALVLLVDDVKGDGQVARDIEELASTHYGQGLRIVVGTDTTGAHFKSPNGRSATAVAAISVEVKVGGLDEDEIASAFAVFEKLNMTFGKGAQFCAEYRAPWVLRDILGQVAQLPDYPAQRAVLPSLFGIDAVNLWREGLSADVDMARGYRALAKDYVRDTTADAISVNLGKLNAFSIPVSAMGATSPALERDLREKGWLRLYRAEDGEDLLVPTSPEFFLAEVARELEIWFNERLMLGQVAAVHELTEKVGRGPFGELLGATVIFQISSKTRDLSLATLVTLLQSPPTYQEMRHGRFMQRVNGKDVGFQVEPNKTMFRVDSDGNRIGDIHAIDEFPAMVGDYTPWMILSHLARFPFETSLEEGLRLDHLILAEVGQCTLALISPAGGTQAYDTVDLQGMQLVHIDNGVVEPITSSMCELFLEEGEDLDSWFADVVEIGSVPLLHRVLVALDTIAVSGLRQGQWARDKLETVIFPALSALCPDLDIRLAEEQ